jgi:hypothetical protein
MERSMKCMICGGQTLPSAKLCLPCRAALRRARDDTISELLPLPRRREAFGYSNSPDVGGRASTARHARAATKSASTGRGPRRITRAQLHAAAVVAFVAAAGVMTFGVTRELQRDRPTAASTVEVKDAAELRPRVSPSTLLTADRDESGPVAAPAPANLAEPPVVASPEIVANRPTRTARSVRPVATKVAVIVEPPSSAASFDPPAIVAAPSPPPSEPRLPSAPLDRSALLTAALARCSGDVLSQFGCAHRARAQHCEGRWGESAQCPAGITNDHGQ